MGYGLMNQDVKAKWVAALRSGEYKQTSEVLRDQDNKFCCLGVLCDIAEKEGLEISSVLVGAENGQSRNDCYRYTTPTDSSISHLPQEVVKWADLHTSFGDKVSYMPGDEDEAESNDLASWNDRGLDFFTIANLIEEQL